MSRKSESSGKVRNYDWRKTLSYDAPVNIVITARGKGKTYGIRKQCITDYIKFGYTFVEICRWANEISYVQRGYFDKIKREFPGWEFKTDGNEGYIRKRGSKTAKWQLLCYFIGLTQQGLLKKMTFVNAHRLIFDEAILERTDRYHDYLDDEIATLANVIDSCTRERDENKARLYCLGNAVDIVNPLFEWLHVTTEPKRGYTWYRNHTVLLHYEDDTDYSATKKHTLTGMMLEGSDSAREATENRFTTHGVSLVAEKTPKASYEFTLKYNSERFAIWTDYEDGYYYVNHKTPKNGRVYSLNLSDSGLNVMVLKRTSPLLKNVYDALRYGIVRFDTIATHHEFIKLLGLLGYR